MNEKDSTAVESCPPFLQAAQDAPASSLEPPYFHDGIAPQDLVGDGLELPPLAAHGLGFGGRAGRRLPLVLASRRHLLEIHTSGRGPDFVQPTFFHQLYQKRRTGQSPEGRSPKPLDDGERTCQEKGDDVYVGGDHAKEYVRDPPPMYAVFGPLDADVAPVGEHEMPAVAGDDAHRAHPQPG